MEDQQLWHLGTKKLRELFAALPAVEKSELAILLSSYQLTKESLAATAAGIDAAAICRECGGQCCLNGKYRLNVLDYLAHVTAEAPIAVDFSQKPLCPYGSSSGCSMEPGLRPADCALFLCDAIDLKLSPDARRILEELEQTLRKLIFKAAQLTGETAGTPLLIWAENAAIKQLIKV